MIQIKVFLCGFIKIFLKEDISKKYILITKELRNKEVDWQTTGGR